MRWVALVLAACGSAPPPPAPIVVHDPPPRSTVVAPVSCGDAGVILRGSVEHKAAGPLKEAAIASACLVDKWSREVLDCVGREAEPHACLIKLEPAQRTTLDKKLKAWASANDEVAEEAVTEPEVPCTIGVGDVGAYAPVLKVVGEERDFAIALRKEAMARSCGNDGWDEAVKRCFAAHQGTDSCRAMLDPDTQREIADQLTEIDTLVAKIAVAKAKPAKTYDCAAVVAVHYADAAWKGKAEPPKKATGRDLVKQQQERKQMIADSRKTMLDACTTEGWNATVRACELIGGGEACSRAIGLEPRWDFPARDVIVNTGIPECDSYLAVVRALLACPKLPEPAKRSLRQTIEMQRQGWGQKASLGSGNPLAPAPVTTTCLQGEQALRQAAPALGCTI